MPSKLFDSTVIHDPEGAVEFIANILESSTEYSIIGKDLDGKILLWNEGARRIYGYEPEEVVGRANSEILHTPEDIVAGKPREIMEAALADGKWEGTLDRVRKNGHHFTARVVITPRRDAAGRPIGFLLISKDISNEIHLTEELKAAHFYTRSLIEANIDALMTTDPLGIITDVNRQMCEMTGLAMDDLIGTPFKRYFTDPRRAEEGIRRVLSEDRVTNYELTMQSKVGKETVVSYNAATFRDSQGRLQGVFAAARDITDQKNMEENLRQVQNYTRGLIEASVDALVTVDPAYRITDVNEQMVRMTDYSRDELIGSPFPDYFTDPDLATAGVQRTLDEGFVTNYVLVLKRKTGVEVVVSFNASIFRDPDGNVRGIFASARDITEQRRLEDELRQAQNYNRGLIESSVDAMITVDPDLVITDVNEQMVRLTEVPKDSLIGSQFDRYFTDPSMAAAGVRQTLRDGYVTNYELTLKTPGGREVLVSFNASIFKDTAGNIRGIFAVARDVTEQRRMEGQLREEQNYSRGLIEASVDALVTVDPQGRITDVNEQMVRLTGYSRKQLVGSPFDDYFTDPERAMIGVRKTFDEGVVKNYELVVRAKSGAQALVSFNAAVFKDTAGNVAGILAAARDISQQKQIEQELREQQTYTRGLIESNIDALMTTDTLGIITDVNRQMCEVTGHGREELIGTPFKDYFTDPKAAEDGIRKVLTEGRVTNYELTIRAKDGKETVVSYNATTFTGAEGQLRGVFAAARDITDQKRLESQIRQQNRSLIETTAFLNNVLESSTEYSIIAKDLNGQILAWNEGARRNYGYTADEMVGKQNTRILHTNEDIESGRVQDLLDTAYHTGKAEGVFERVRKNGERFTASVAITLRKDADSTPVGYVLISKDITEQKLLEEQLQRKNEELEEQNRRVQEANRLKSEFLANMSHELRTPLNGIIGFTELMYDGKVGEAPAAHKEFLGDILTSSKHLLQLINDVLDLAKVEAGKIAFRPEPVHLPTLIGQVRDTLRTLAATKRMRIESHVDTEVAEIVADPARLKQVLYNYLSNAIKFTPDEGQVMIRVKAEGPGAYRLEVQDTGIGIKPEDVSKLFVEFQQLDASAAKKYAGTGLGLAMTKRIAEAQGGSVGVQSTPGKGSTFYAILPRTLREIPESIAVQEETPSAEQGRYRVLVIEDALKDQSHLARVLREAGYSVQVASTGVQALAACRSEAYDAITLDILLPDMSGWDVLRAIRSDSLNRQTPVVVATVMTDEGIGRALAIHDYLVKPIHGDELVASLERAGANPTAATGPVLIVDDDSTDRRVTERYLAAGGYRSVLASDGESALREAVKERPAAVVLDLVMPGMDGFAFLSKLRRTRAGRQTPVIVWTGADLTAEQRSGLQSAAQAVLVKGDIATSTLLEEIARHLPARRLLAVRSPGTAEVHAEPPLQA